MQKVASLIVFSVLLLAGLSARALTVTPVPGTTNQTTPQSAFLPIAPAVRVTDSAGLPIAGASVTFSVIPYTGSNGAVFFTGTGFSFENSYTTTTDANGIATSGLGPFGYIAGPSGVTATATVQGPLGPESATATIPATITPGGATSFKIVSGNHQKAPAGSPYTQPWVVQAIDASGNPVPNAAVLFFAPADPTVPSVTFNGTNSVWVRADASGIAISPLPVANAVQGKGEGFASTLNFGVTISDAFFEFTNTTPLPTSGGGGGGGGPIGCGAQRKGNGNCGNGNGSDFGK